MYFLPTILSRFDLIFIVRDIRDEKKDREIAEHVMGVHINSNGIVANEKNGLEYDNDLTISTMKRFISYCRMKCAPSLSESAADILQSHYIKIRHSQRQRNVASDEKASSIPITVRQLEAIVRISEALAKMSLSVSVTAAHVAEAIRLFKVSTGIASMSMASSHSSLLNPQSRERIQIIEGLFKRRISVGSDVPVATLVKEFVEKGFAEAMVRKAIQVMILRGDLHEYHMRKVVRRIS